MNMKHENIVTINDDYDDWKIKGLIAEVVGYDRDKRYLVKLLENSQTDYLNIGDTIWLKPYWLDGIEKICNRFTAIHKFNYDNENPQSKKQRWEDYKARTRVDNTKFWITCGEESFDNLNRSKLLRKIRHCLQNDLDFLAGVHKTSKWGSASGFVVESSFKENTYSIEGRNFKEIEKEISSFQKKIGKLISKY